MNLIIPRSSKISRKAFLTFLLHSTSHLCCDKYKICKVFKIQSPTSWKCLKQAKNKRRTKTTKKKEKQEGKKCWHLWKIFTLIKHKTCQGNVKSVEESTVPGKETSEMDGDKVREGPGLFQWDGCQWELGRKAQQKEQPQATARGKSWKTQGAQQDLFCICPEKRGEQKFVLMPRSFYAFLYNFFSAFLSCYNSAATAVKNNIPTPAPNRQPQLVQHHKPICVFN